jgi:hypothetical protein
MKKPRSPQNTSEIDLKRRVGLRDGLCESREAPREQLRGDAEAYVGRGHRGCLEGILGKGVMIARLSQGRISDGRR